MQWINRLPSCDQAGPETKGPSQVRMDMIRGTIQRVNYGRRELRVIAQARPWEFVVSADCRLWFDSTPAILRCFHPLDPVTVLFEEQETGCLAKVIYAWEPQPTAGACRPPATAAR